MNDQAPKGHDGHETIDLRKEIERSEWKSDPVVGFDQKASLAVAQWVLCIFGGAYLLSFLGTFLLFWKSDATFEKGAELVKFLVQSLLPLVTLAVGYYLGDRARQQAEARR